MGSTKPLKSGSGLKVSLIRIPILEWAGRDLGSWFNYGGVRVSVPGGAKLLWPARQHNPYKKDGSSTLAEARLVLCLPFTGRNTKQEVTLEITGPAGRR